MNWTALVFQVLQALALVAVPALATLIGKFIAGEISKQKNAQIQALASVAVHWAEDQISSGNKLQAAAQKLSDLTKGKVTVADATTLVAATYANLTNALASIAGNASAPSSTASAKS